ncbi:hypothetical protein FXB42_06120 [Acetobacterium wieringae]|uniref:Uncharacterized protein n=1 Tax=Acetobacterium wieringae TaxID=52694 RepID=A0A5D0WRT0_9FIRM|nr:hypothetical protein [Acetobacterium wieringae]TYC86548.1 hypothetical protein FXB42_06120 [Acetobacterium wieringae]
MSNIKVDEYFREHLEKNEVENVVSDLCVMVFTDRTLADGRLMEMLKYIKTNYPDVYGQLIKKCDESQYKRFSQNEELIIKDINEDVFADAVVALKNNFCFERIEDIRILGNHLYSKKESVEKKIEDTVAAKTREGKPVGQKGTRPVGEQRRSPKKKKISGGLVLIMAVVALIVVVAIILVIK